MLTPLDIHNKEFSRAFRGYSEKEVDEFLDEVIRDFEALLKENAQLKKLLDELQEKVQQYRNIEETLNNTLLIAQSTAEEVKANAQKEAELIIRKANAEAEQIIAEGRQKLARAQEELAQVKRETEVFRTKVKNAVRSYLELLESDEFLEGKVQS